MSKNQAKYKPKPAGITDMETGRFVRALRQEEHRRNLREANFSRHRFVPETMQSSPNDESTEPNVNVRLARWRKERELLKKMEAQKKKPVFKVGIVHHKFFSPPVGSKTVEKHERCHGKSAPKPKHRPSPVKRITRATAKRLEAKAATASTTPIAGPSRLPLKSTEKTRRRLPSMTRKAATSFAPENHSFKAPSGLPDIPMFGRIVIPKLRHVSTENENVAKSEVGEEEPWPRASHPPVDVMAAETRRSSFARQHTQQEMSPDSLDVPVRGNSSLETFELRLSSEEDSPEKTELPSAAVSQIDNPEDPNLEIAANALKNETPPRSGTPVPASFSPYVVSSRGKDSARKEQMQRMGVRRSGSNEIPTKETVMESLNISVEDEERTAKYFKFILAREIVRLTELCGTWEDIMNDPELPEDPRFQINQAIGQTKLLMGKKFERFRCLVLDCETGKGEMLVQCRDLQGFWDLIDMDIKNCESRFVKLEVLRSKGWVEEEIAMRRKKATKPAAVKPKINAKSSARSFILAARKKKMSEEIDDDVIAENNTASSSSPAKRDQRRSVNVSPAESSPESRRKSVSKATPKKTPISLRKAVQLSEASKSIRSPLAVMKISKMCKTPEVTLDETISYINSDQTPGRGILKKSESSESETSCQRKSTRKVDFNDDVFPEEAADGDEVNEELQNSIDLGRALARIDSYDTDSNDDIIDNVTVRKVEKRLDFEDASFEETVNTNTAESSAVIAAIPEHPDDKNIPTIKIIPETPLRIEESAKETSTARVLRNRTVAATVLSPSNRRSRRKSAVDEQNSSISTIAKENCDPISRSMKSDASDESEIKIIENPVPKRRSTRKSVRFNADDCTACTPKPALPATPRTRRSRQMSLLRDTPVSTVPRTHEDLIAFESPS